MASTSSESIRTVADVSADRQSLRDKLNHAWHKRALQAFLVIVLAHWGEHVVQAFQIYGLGWRVQDSRGILGQFFPWLVTSETLHYFYAIVMLVVIYVLREGFEGRSHTWWMIAFWIQFWHHIEHALLIGQVIVGRNLFHSPVPTSIVQLWIPRVELHLFYNTIVTIPMLIAMYYHMFPLPGEKASECTCAYVPRSQRACSV